MRALDVIACVAMIASLVSAPFLLFLGIPYLTRRTRVTGNAGLASIIVFAISVAVGIAAAETSTRIGHDEVLRKLN